MKSFCLIAFSILLCFNALIAQRQILGRVTSYNSGESVIGATVVARGTNIGTLTDFDGNYQIEVDSSRTALVFSFLGYERQEIKIENDSVISVVLVRERILLPQLTVTAHYFHNRQRRVCEIVTTNRRGVSETYQFEYVIAQGRFRGSIRQRRSVGIGKCRITIGKSYRIHIPEVGWTGWIRSHERNCVTAHYYDINGEKTDSPISFSQEKKWENTSAIIQQDFLKHISENLNYPATAIERGILGRVIVGFTVNFDGSITNIEILRSNSELLSKEVLSVIHSAPKLNELRWLGRESDFPVGFRLPIFFRLERVTDLSVLSDL